MESFDIDKWIKDVIDSEEANDYLYNLYFNSTSNKTDVKRGFKRFCENTGLKKNWASYKLTFSFAAVAVAAIVYASLLTIMSRFDAPDWTSISTSSNENREMELCDGTKIQIGPCSNIIFPTSFDGAERKIFAEGDVYLDVAKDEKKPFIVSLQGIDIKVHGTKFHLYSFSGMADQEIALAQGSVSVSIDGGKTNINMVPREILKYNRANKTFKKALFDIETYENQRTGSQILFDSEGLLSITQKLSNRFGKRVLICDESLLNQTYYASFINGEGLPEILNRLGEKGGFSIKYDGENYLIMR